MPEGGAILVVDKIKLFEKAAGLAEQGYRLVQVCCTKKDGYELTYSFDLDYRLVNLRLHVVEGEEVESIGAVYPYAFLYENEIRDLFGVNIVNINVDYAGNFYRTAVKTPFK